LTAETPTRGEFRKPLRNLASPRLFISMRVKSGTAAGASTPDMGIVQIPQAPARRPWSGYGATERMDKLVIRGGTPLLGTVRISGAKNAALPAMAAALLTDEPVILENIPAVRDIETTRRLLSAMGAEVELGYGRAHHRTTLCCRNLISPEASYELVHTMRASTLVLGPLLARCGRARVSLPGGCAIGARPI